MCGFRPGAVRFFRGRANAYAARIFLSCVFAKNKKMAKIPSVSNYRAQTGHWPDAKNLTWHGVAIIPLKRVSPADIRILWYGFRPVFSGARGSLRGVYILVLRACKS